MELWYNMGNERGGVMKTSIRRKIDDILNENMPAGDEREHDDVMPEGEPIHLEIFVMINNIEAFYGPGAQPISARLLESFLLETMIGLKKNPDNIIVESGDYYVRSVAFTPTPEVAWMMLEDAVIINTMLDEYNRGLGKEQLPLMACGIGLSVYPAHIDDQDEHGDGEHDHGDDFSDPNDVARSLASFSVDEVLPMRLSGEAHDFLKRHDSEAMERLFETTETDCGIVYDGDVISEE